MSITQYVTRLLNASRQTKHVIIGVLDAVLVLMALWLSFFLRLDTFQLPDGRMVLLILVAPVVAIPFFIVNGLYQTVIRYMATDIIWVVLRAVTGYCLIWTLLVLLSGIGGVPRSVILINWVICLVFIGGYRFTAEWLINVYLRIPYSKSEPIILRRVLIYGAGEAGVQLAALLSSSRQTKIVGFIDDASRLHNQVIKGFKVYPAKNLNSLIHKVRVSEILLAMPSVSRNRKREIFSLLATLSVRVRTLPDITAITEGKVKAQDVQDIDIADLLGRESVPADATLLRKNIDGKVVMVTGAGGSIGAELCRQITLLNPKMLVLYEQNEFNLYSIERALNQQDVELVAVLGSVCERQRLLEQCEKFGVNTLFHAAAYKHVPLIEANPQIGVQNNILGSYATALAAVTAKVACFVMISTDKAVRPTNVMGASKRFAEQILQAMGNDSIGAPTKFIIVRFGNVIESSGSVIPLFRKQIKAGGPVTVTHRQVTRYFMSIPEAAQLVLQASAMGKGGEVFVLDMGKPIKIYDLALKMIKLSGLTLNDADHPNGDIAIKISGMRAGEKLHEELLIGENVSTTAHPQIMMANEKFLSWDIMQQKIDELENVADSHVDIQHILASVVEDYSLKQF